MKKIVIISILLMLSGSAVGDGIGTANTPSISGGIGGGINEFDGGISSGKPTPLTPCGDGQLDFQDACGTTLYMVIWR